jgi:hypothetical protein
LPECFIVTRDGEDLKSKQDNIKILGFTFEKDPPVLEVGGLRGEGLGLANLWIWWILDVSIQETEDWKTSTFTG